MRKAMVGGALALALSLGVSAAQTPPAPANPTVAAQLERAIAQRAAGQTKAAHATLADLTTSRAFSAEAPEVRGRVLALDAEVANELGLTAYAAVAARTGSKLPGQEGLVAQVALYDAIATQNDAAMRRALTTLATDFPRTLDATPDLPIQIAAGRPTRDNDARVAQARLAEALVTHWRPKDPAQVTDYLKLAVIESRLAEGQVDGARELTKSLDAINIVRSIRADRRYDKLFEDGWSMPTPREMAEGQLVRLRAVRAAYPRRLSLARQEADLLGSLGAETEALRIVDSAIAQAERSPNTFEDTDIFLTTLYELKVRLLDALQRHDEALIAARRGAATPQQGEPNVFLLLDLASALTDENPREALRLVRVARGRRLNPRGDATALKIQACANHALGDIRQSDAAQRQLLAMRVNRANFIVIQSALCRGSADEAAAALIAALGNLAERSEAIRNMQVDVPTRPPISPQEHTRRELFRQVVFRPDVQAALAPHGRILKLTPEEVWRQ